MLHGACLCRGVTYAVADAFDYALNCHCSQCRRATGAACKPFGGLPVERLKLTSGEASVFRFGEGADHDVHCRTCGSLLYSVVRGGDYAHVAYGTLDDTPGLAPQAHIFVGSKAPWHAITDELPQHDTFPSAEG